MKKTTKQQFKPMKAWAVISTHPSKEYNIPYCGTIIPAGWGSMQLWVFKERWEAKEAIEADELERHMDTPEIIPVLIQPLPARGKTNPSKKKK